MNIAFDAVAILGPMSRNRGIGNYAKSQFINMINNDKGNNYFFLNVIDETFKLCDYVNTDNFQEDYLYTGKDNLLISFEEFYEIYGAIIRKYIRDNNIDVFYITSPFESSYCMYKKEWFENVRVVMTVYDIIPYVMKEHYLADRTTYRWYMKCIDSLRWADKLLVISKSVKDDLIECLDFKPEQIDIIWGAVDDRYKIISVKDEEKDKLYKKFNISKPFIICTGGDDTRKNLDGLIRGYSYLENSIRQEYQLVIVCKLSESTRMTLSDIAEKHGVLNDIIFTGFVTDNELLALYNLATLMAFPSKYEGFGLPIVEAWACGTPVLTSNNSSLCQIGGDAAVLVNPNEDKDISRGLEYALQSDNNKELTVKGIRRLGEYAWEKVALNAIGFINQIEPYNKEHKSDSNSKIKIAFFTPLPPVESGISDYSVDVVRGLSDYCDIDIFIDNGYTPTVSLPSNVHYYKHIEYEKMRNNYFSTVYQVGNSEFHFYMYDYIRKYRGIVVLHDYNLHSSLYYYSINAKKGNYKLYRKIVIEDYSDSTTLEYLSDIEKKICGPRIYDLPVNGYLVNYADKVIVHSEYSKKLLLEKNLSRSVNKIFLYADMGQNVQLTKDKIGFSEDNFIFAAFGGIHETKRAIPILHAFAKLRKENDKVRLIFVGKLADNIKDEFNQVVNYYSLSDSVFVTGYTDLETFNGYFDITDVCLNLRFPYNGETSGSLMRMLGKGKCVVVNDIGSFSEFPDNACLKLPSVDTMHGGEEIDYIYNAMHNLSEDKNAVETYGDNARKFAKENLDIGIISEKYFRCITEPLNVPVVNIDKIHRLTELNDYTENEIDLLARTLAYCF